MSPSSSPSSPPALAESCVRFVEAAVGVAPDYTPETLPLLDHYARSIPEDADAEVMALFVHACGAYFGEVVRRTLRDGLWEGDELDPTSLRLVFAQGALRFNPMGMAVEVISREDAGGWEAHVSVVPAHSQQVQAAVERLGEVPLDQYFTFVACWEVIERAHEVVASRTDSP